MDALPLTPEQEAEAQRIQDAVMEGMSQEVRQLARLLASRSTNEFFGQTEFQLRDGCHRMGRLLLQGALDERKKGGTKVRV
jgi:hypothetical protein